MVVPVNKFKAMGRFASMTLRLSHNLIVVHLAMMIMTARDLNCVLV